MIRRVIVYFYICSCLLSYDPVKTCTCFPKKMYDFCGKHVRVFCKSRTCFLDKVMAFFNVLIISVLFERSNDRGYKRLTMGIIKVLQCLL